MNLLLLLLHLAMYRRKGLWFRLTNSAAINFAALILPLVEEVIITLAWWLFLLLFHLNQQKILLYLFSLGAKQVTG